jgi:hypothetical protein
VQPGSRLAAQPGSPGLARVPARRLVGAIWSLVARPACRPCRAGEPDPSCQ